MSRSSLLSQGKTGSRVPNPERSFRPGKEDQLEPMVLGDGRQVPVKLRRHARAKRYVLRVSGGVIHLTIPTTGSVKGAMRWMAGQTAFVENEIRRTPVPKPFVEGALIPVLGTERRITLGGPRGGRLTDHALEVTDVAQCERLIRKEVHAAVRQEAENAWHMLGVSPATVTLRAMTSRWGSCSSTGATSFNWRLAFAPYDVLRYVVIHEAAHRVHMNHSQQFWSVVEELMPNYAVHEAWIKARGRELFAYGLQS